ncbi:dTDP-4-dehydrorhamnose 3,5-epimerase [Citrobacter sedlakii]
MNIFKTEIPDLLILEPTIIEDERGFFMETYNKHKFEQIIERKVNFIQDNHSKSQRGVLRGLHYQIGEFAQSKLVRCVNGSVYDVAVDLRMHSPTFKKWFGTILSAENKKQLWIPEGFAHGFLAMTNGAEFVYKVNNYYHKKSERAILWNDPSIAIKWPELDVDYIVSLKDKAAMNFENAEYFEAL